MYRVEQLPNLHKVRVMRFLVEQMQCLHFEKPFLSTQQWFEMVLTFEKKIFFKVLKSYLKI